MMESSCVHGQWVDGVCECQQGYETVFSESLDPVYCSQKIVLLVNLNNAYDPKNILHYGTMALTVGLASCSLLVLISFFYSLWEVRTLKTKITTARKSRVSTEAEQMRRKDVLNAELWIPQNTFHCVNQTNDEGTSKKELVHSATVLHQYKPQTKEELRLNPGDIINEVAVLEQGWCRGKLNGTVGFFPTVYVELHTVTTGDQESNTTHGNQNSVEILEMIIK